GSAGGPVRLLHHGRDHRDPRWPARDDLGGHRRGRAGDRPVDGLAWPALPDRRGDLAGVFQVVLALLGAARLMRFIPRQVMVGFVNALAILIFISQVSELIGVPWLVYPLFLLAALIVFLLPRVT